MNLVIQGASLAADVLGALSGTVAPKKVVRLGPAAFRLEGARDSEVIAPFCSEWKLDWAWVPDNRRLAELKLVALDMDSTLVQMETIDEMGAALGVGSKVAAVTERAMQGEIDYAQSLRERVALLKGLDEAALERIAAERMALSPGAEQLVGRCRELGIRTLLVSGGFEFFISRLKARLDLDETLANDLEIAHGRLTGRVRGPIVDGAAKAAGLEAAIRRLGIARSQSLAIGDGANDVPMLRAAGVSVAFRGKRAAVDAAIHTLDHAGLDGALNLFID